MKKTIPILLLSALVLTAGCEQSQDQATTTAANGANAAQSVAEPDAAADAAAENGDTLVTVNGQRVDRKTFAAMLAEWNARSPGSVSSPQVQGALLNKMVNFVILSQEAERQDLDESERVRAALEWMRVKTLAQAMLNEHLSESPVDEDALRAAYEEKYPAAGAREYKARHILVETEDEARTLIVELEGGADFAELAREHSTGPSASRGGDLGWFGPADMVPPFSEAVEEMEKGAVSADPVETGFGWHVILLEDVRETPPPPFEAVEDELRSELRQERIQDYVRELREDADIQVESASQGAAGGDAAGTRAD